MVRDTIKSKDKSGEGSPGLSTLSSHKRPLETTGWPV